MANITKPVVIDKRAARLAEIDAEIVRLTKIKSEKQAEFDKDFSKNLAQMDHGLQSRLQSQIREIQSKVEKLCDERGDVELNGVPPPPVPKAISSSCLDASDKLDLRQYADEDDRKFFTAAHAIYSGLSSAMKLDADDLKRAPTVRMMLMLMSQIRQASVEGQRRLEEKLTELSQKQLRPVYRGTWQEDTKYVENDMVTAKGSVWAAKAPSRGFKPGENPSFWQLCVRRGNDGRDSSGRRQPQIEPEG